MFHIEQFGFGRRLFPVNPSAWSVSLLLAALVYSSFSGAKDSHSQ